MPINLDKKMLHGFSQEVKSYLPSIREGIAAFDGNPNSGDSLSEALRYIHTIKGASALMGLSALSQIASYVEELLEDIIAGNTCLDSPQNQWLNLTIAQLDPYLEQLLNGKGESKEIIALIEKEYIQLKSGLEKLDCQENRAYKNLEVDIRTDALDSIETVEALPMSDNTCEHSDSESDSLEDTNIVDLVKDRNQSQHLLYESELINNNTDEISKNQSILDEEGNPQIVQFISESSVIDNVKSDLLEPEQSFVSLIDVESCIVQNEYSSEEDTSQTYAHDELTNINVDTNVHVCFDHDDNIDTTVNNHDIDTSSRLNKNQDCCDAYAQRNIVNRDSSLFEDNDIDDNDTEDTRYNKLAIIDEYLDGAIHKSDACLQKDISASRELEEIIDHIDVNVRETYNFKDRASEDLISLLSADYSTRYLLFTISKSYYAVAVANILEIGHVPTITPLPNVPSWLKGIINLRGEILSVIDVGQFFELGQSITYDDKRLIVVKTVRGDLVTSLIVDLVNGFIQLESLQNNYSSLGLDQNIVPYVNGIFELEGLILSTLDLERFLQSTDLRRF
jgi:chemotaxis signal transduction protein/HPt (histidine-containing phosphotransfer) domain-containing protein